MIIFYYGGESRPDPEWIPISVDEINKKKFTTHGKSIHRIRAHIQELPENGADASHLTVLHSPFIFKIPGVNHIWKVEWNVGEGEILILLILIFVNPLLSWF